MAADSEDDDEWMQNEEDQMDDDHGDYQMYENLRHMLNEEMDGTD